jgi:bifunctional DNA-binding transcriptional regulator/antitoxin component of YhaV-PrlF toxin-antitoxin module
MTARPSPPRNPGRNPGRTRTRQPSRAAAAALPNTTQVRLNRRGQLTIPVALRTQLGLERGATLALACDGNGLLWLQVLERPAAPPTPRTAAPQASPPLGTAVPDAAHALERFLTELQATAAQAGRDTQR